MSLKKKALSSPKALETHKMSPLAIAIAMAATIPAGAASAATFTVDTLTMGAVDVEDGDITLNDAIFQAENSAGADTIVFSSSLSVTEGGYADLALNMDLTVSEDVIIDASNIVDEYSNLNLRLELNGNSINVDESALTISNMVIDDNTSSENFINASDATITATNVQVDSSEGSDKRFISAYNSSIAISDSSFIGGDHGEAGAVIDAQLYGGANNTITISNSEFDGNVADEGGSVVSVNATDSTLTLSVSYSEFANNNADNGESTGGGVFFISSNYSANTVSITNSDFDENDATQGRGGVVNFRGYSPEDAEAGLTLTVTNSSFDGGFTSSAGGVFSLDGDGGFLALSITDSTFSDNDGNDGGTISIESYRSDAAVTLDIQGSTFEGENAGGNGGSIRVRHEGAEGNLASALALNITGSTFYGSTASDSTGGAVYLSVDYADSILTITDSLFDDNYSYLYGGAIDVRHDSGDFGLTISGSTFSNNEAYEGQGGAVAVYVEEGDTAVVINNSEFSSNSSEEEGGALTIKGDDNVSLTVSDSTFSDNDMDSGFGGGAIKLQNNDSIATSVSITNSVFYNNEGNGGGALALDVEGDYGEAGQATLALTIADSNFSSNATASGSNGGAVAVDTYYVTTTIDVTNATFYANQAASSGGAVYVSQGLGLATVTIADSTFDSNLGGVGNNDRYGGAIAFYTDGDFSENDNREDLSAAIVASITNTVFSYNGFEGEGNGGAISVATDSEDGDRSQIDLTVSSSSFNNNVASLKTSESYYGGAIFARAFVEGNVNLNIGDSSFDGNSAGAGGAISLKVSGTPGSSEYAPANLTAVITGSTFVGNAADNGGVVYARSSSEDAELNLSFFNSTLYNNYADKDGSAILTNNYNGTSQIAIVNTTISHNMTEDGGSFAVDIRGTDASTGSLLIANSVIANSMDADVKTDDDGNDYYADIRDFTIDNWGAEISISNSLIEMPEATTRISDLIEEGGSWKGIDPMLGALANNGGTTKTQLPMEGSPLIGNGDNSFLPEGTETDQRGEARIDGDNVDIGSVEAFEYTSEEEADIAEEVEGTKSSKSGPFGSLGTGFLVGLLSVFGLRRKRK